MVPAGSGRCDGESPGMGPRARWRVAVAATMFVALPATAEPPGSDALAPASFVVPGGARYATHGPDTEVVAPSLQGTKDAIVCVPRSTPHFEAIVARAHDDRER